MKIIEPSRLRELKTLRAYDLAMSKMVMPSEESSSTISSADEDAQAKKPAGKKSKVSGRRMAAKPLYRAKIGEEMNYFDTDPVEPCQSQKRGTCEPTYTGIISFLWQLLDDIDTAGDVAKGDDKLFRSIVERTQKRRWETGILCDGYKLDISAGIKQDTPDRMIGDSD